VREGRTIVRQLGKDTTFKAALTGYVPEKSLLNADFERSLWSASRAKGTEQQFHVQLRRLYDPRALLK